MLCYIWTIINLHSHQENSHCCVVMRQILFHIMRQNVLEPPVMHQIIKHSGFLSWLIRCNYSLASEMLNTHTVIDSDKHCEIQCFWKIKSFARLPGEYEIFFLFFFFNNKHIVVCTQFMKTQKHLSVDIFPIPVIYWIELDCTMMQSHSLCLHLKQKLNGFLLIRYPHWKGNVVFIA